MPRYWCESGISRLNRIGNVAMHIQCYNNSGWQIRQPYRYGKTLQFRLQLTQCWNTARLLLQFTDFYNALGFAPRFLFTGFFLAQNINIDYNGYSLSISGMQIDNKASFPKSQFNLDYNDVRICAKWYTYESHHNALSSVILIDRKMLYSISRLISTAQLQYSQQQP